MLTEKEQFEVQDITEIRKATFFLHKSVTSLVYKMGQLENSFIKSTINNSGTDTVGHANYYMNECHLTQGLSKNPDEQRNPEKFTYAAATQKKQITGHQNTANGQPEKWTTPKTTTKIETIIRVDEMDDPKEVLQRLKNEIRTKDVDGGFKSIRHLKSGAIVVESHSESQQQKLKRALEENTNIKVKDLDNTDPMFMITGIEKGLTEQDFINELIRLNIEIENELKCKVNNKITVIARKNCRNPHKENWILQAPAEITKWFLKRHTVNFDLVKVFVQEHINLAICLKCSGFGHVAKYCKEDLCCHKCGKGHAGKDCTETKWKCPNCVKMKYPPEECIHSARDSSCPVLRKRLAQYRNHVNYGITESFL